MSPDFSLEISQVSLQFGDQFLAGQRRVPAQTQSRFLWVLRSHCVKTLIHTIRKYLQKKQYENLFTPLAIRERVTVLMHLINDVQVFVSSNGESL